MVDVSKSLRNKRFEVRNRGDIKLVIDSPSGSRIDMALLNCSLTGLRGYVEAGLKGDEDIEAGKIIPASKLTWTDHETSLGRLVVRNLKTDKSGGTEIGFSIIDVKVPVTGPLSKFISGKSDDKSAFDYELSPENFSMATFATADQNNVDLFERCRQFSYFLGEWKATPQYQYMLTRTASKGSRVNLKHVRRERRNDYIIMGSNDYLGMASHPEVMTAAKDAIDRYGFGSTGSPATTGWSDIHEQLCVEIADVFHKDQAILFNSGYTANVGTINSLTGPQDFIAADILSHASIQDALQMTHATSRLFRHNDPVHLEKLLAEHREQFAGSLVITEGVFSMDGDAAPLDQIIQVAKLHKSRIFVDEAHSFGVIGPNGFGICDKFGLESSVDVIMGTFSKICGGIGGFIAADREVIDWLIHTSRGFIFTVSIPPSTAAAALKALQIFRSDRSILANLQKNIRHFVSAMRSLGAPIRPDHESAVVPVVVGDQKKLGIMASVLRDYGVYCVPIVYPAVARNQCRFRFTLMAQHTVSDLDYVVSIFERAMKQADFAFDQVAPSVVRRVA